VIRFFIVGTGRCGTTLLRNLLNLHPDVYVPTESHWIPLQYEFYGLLRNPPAAYIDVMQRTCYENGHPTMDSMADAIGMTSSELLQIVQAKFGNNEPTLVEFNDELYAVLAGAAGRCVAGDKTPDYCSYLTMLQSLWPSARFVHIIRDGRDVALSMSKHSGYQRLVSLRFPNWVPVSFDKRYRLCDSTGDGHTLEAYIKLWDLRIRRTLDEASRLASGTFVEIRFEDLLREPKRTINELAKFLELPLSNEWLGKAAELIDSGNTGKITDHATYRALTDAARDTLAALGYSTGE
jgi:hypothetical protein